MPARPGWSPSTGTATGPPLWCVPISTACRWRRRPASTIVEAGLLLHRQAVEIGTHHNGGPVAVPVDGDQPGLAGILGDVEAERAHLRGEPRGRFHFLKRKLRMGLGV